MCHMWSRNCWPFQSTWVHPGFSGVCVARSLVFCVMFHRSLFVLLSLFFWPLCCLSFDLLLLVNPLVSSNTSVMFCCVLFLCLYCCCFVIECFIFLPLCPFNQIYLPSSAFFFRSKNINAGIFIDYWKYLLNYISTIKFLHKNINICLHLIKKVLSHCCSYGDVIMVTTSDTSSHITTLTHFNVMQGSWELQFNYILHLIQSIICKVLSMWKTKSSK
jgi:hypothetical protein